MSSEPLTTVATFLEACASDDPRRRAEANAMVANCLDPKAHWRIYRCAGSPIDGQWMHYSGTTRGNAGPPPYATACPGDPDQGNLWWKMWEALPRDRGEVWEYFDCIDYHAVVNTVYRVDAETRLAALAASLLLALDKLKENE